MKRGIKKLTAAAAMGLAVFIGGESMAYAATPILYKKKPFINEQPEKREITEDARKGKIDKAAGILTGDESGYSDWRQDELGWKFQYADGTYASQCWEKINNAWYYFKEDGYASSGWQWDPAFDGWFYIDLNEVMKTGWQFIAGKWYYFYDGSDGVEGKMASDVFLNGYEIDENGVWTGVIK